jgi:hypothetical protein
MWYNRAAKYLYPGLVIFRIREPIKRGMARAVTVIPG